MDKMIQPIGAKRFINNGWNAQNRRLLQQRIGKQECLNLVDIFQRIEKNGNAIPSLNGNAEKLVLNVNDSKLINKKGHLKLIFSIQIENLKRAKRNILFKDESINMANIEKNIKNTEAQIRSRLGKN